MKRNLTSPHISIPLFVPSLATQNHRDDVGLGLGPGITRTVTRKGTTPSIIGPWHDYYRLMCSPNVYTHTHMCATKIHTYILHYVHTWANRKIGEGGWEALSALETGLFLGSGSAQQVKKTGRQSWRRKSDAQKPKTDRYLLRGIYAPLVALERGVK
jgi:hypothetical protein